MLKHTLFRSAISRLTHRGSFSLRRGLNSYVSLLKLGIILLGRNIDSPPKRRRRPIGVALAQAVLRLASSAYASLREHVRYRARSYRPAAPKSTARRRSRGRSW